MATDSVLSFGEDVDLPMLETADDESAVIDDEEDYDDEPDAETEDDSQSGHLDWESDENPYRRQLRDIEEEFGGGPDKLKERFSGLQRSVQEKEEARRAEEARRIQLEDAFFQSQIQDLEPQQQQAAWMQLQGERMRQEQVRQDSARRQQVSAYESMLDSMARSILINELSQSMGVPREKLSRFNDPEMMVAFAEEYKEMRTSARREHRKESRADSFEGGGNVSRAKKPTQYEGDLDAAAMDFAKLRLK